MPEPPFRVSHFVARHFFVLLAISAILLIPGFWHRHIQAGDLASHTYNAWLTSLAAQGKAPGLWISSQTNNILCDILLFRVGSIIGFVAAERIVFCGVVLTFFWGAFCLAGAASGRRPWFLIPLLAMLSYGWTLNMGFLNFYLSLGLSFIGLAFLWRARKGDYLCAAALLPFIWTAHPLGFAWYSATAFYLLMARWLGSRWHWTFLLGILGIITLGRWYLLPHYRLEGTHIPFVLLNGGDQIVLGKRYLWLYAALILSVIGCTWLDLARSPKNVQRALSSLPLQLFVLGFLGLALVPDVIWLDIYAVPVTAIVFRFTLVLGVLGCCILARLNVRLLFAIVTGVIALVYFGLLFVDTAKADAMENRAESLVRQLPQGARVIVTFLPLSNLRIFAHHIVDRACIGHCFVFDNYEPASGQFRVRANVGARDAEWDPRIIEHMMDGTYVVTQDDLPTWLISECGPEKTSLCVQLLAPRSLSSLHDETVGGK